MASSKSQLRRGGRGRSCGASMRRASRRRALWRPTTCAMQARQSSPIVANGRKCRSRGHRAAGGPGRAGSSDAHAGFRSSRSLRSSCSQGPRPRSRAAVVARRLHRVVGAKGLVADARVIAGAFQGGRRVPGRRKRPRSAKATARLSVRCSSGTPPSCQRAFCSPADRAAKLSPPRTTSACSQPE